MSALGNDAKKTAGATSANTGTVNDGIGDIGSAVHTPRFMPTNLLDLSICNSQEELDKTKQALADFKKIVAWTKQKFKAQETAADLALELAKSQNALVSHFAKTVLKQAKSDTELAALLQALPEMIQALNGTTQEKKQEKVKTFTDRLSAAGKGQKAKK